MASSEVFVVTSLNMVLVRKAAYYLYTPSDPESLTVPPELLLNTTLSPIFCRKAFSVYGQMVSTA